MRTNPEDISICWCKRVHSINLLAGLRVSRIFFVAPGRMERGGTKQKCEICRTLRADCMDALYTDLVSKKENSVKNEYIIMCTRTEIQENRKLQESILG